MKRAKPLFDAATQYRVAVQGRVEQEWLQDFDDTAKISVDADRKMEHISVLSFHTDQAGIVGLIRRLPGLGTTTKNFRII